MKKALINISFLVFAIFAFKQTEAKAKFQITYIDTTTSDTVRFFRNLVNHQLKYEGQPLSVLLKDIPYKIQWYYPLISQQVSIIPGIIISFLDDKSTFKEGNNYNKKAVLVITWKTPVASKDISQLKLKNTDKWGDAEVKYFSPLIIDSIELTMPDPNIKN